jgi:hypothetical protein
MTGRLLVIALALSTAPFQCGHERDPSLRWDETPGDALWNLAGRFREQHDEAAARQTLQYLVERYPSSRWAQAARDELGPAPPPSSAGDVPASPGSSAGQGPASGTARRPPSVDGGPG